MSLSSYHEIKFWARKLKEYYPHQSADPKNLRMFLQMDTFADPTSLPITSVYTNGPTARLASLLPPGYWLAAVSKNNYFI